MNSSKSLKIEELKLLYNTKAIDGLHGINLEINQGDIIGLMGPSGCGKSTLARVIAGKLEMTSGIVKHNFKNIFYLEDSLLLEEQTVLENFVNYAHGDTQNQKITRARMACSDLEITNYIKTKVSHLSTGQRQRVLLGLALVANSDFIILDEPFSHLEAPLKRELVEIIFPLFKEIESTLIWISHDQQLMLQYAQKIALMNYGKIIQFDAPETIYFHPTSMFALDFFGEANKEFLIDGKSHVWEIDFQTTLNNPLLAYRPQAIEIAKEEEYQGTYPAYKVRSHFDGLSYLHQFKFVNNKINSTIYVRTTKALISEHYQLKINLDLVCIIN